MKRILGFLVLSSIGIACSTDESKSHVSVMLTDSPGEFEEVNIDIQGVEVHRAEGNQTSGWVALDVNEGVYNVLALTNGLDTLLAEADLPSGRLSQVRLILGSNNTVKLYGNVYQLMMPSKLQAGVRVLVQTQMSPGVSYVVTLDFDASRSIALNGLGAYTLKPVIRVLSEATTGAIDGSVVPVESLPAVFALVGSDTVAATFADSTGFFLLRGVPAGTYTVTFDPKPGYAPAQVGGVEVTVGNVANVGQVQIN